MHRPAARRRRRTALRRTVSLIALCGVVLCASVPAAVAAGPLSRWQTALANRATAPATWMAYGDSITEGQGASTRQNRWISRTLAGLRTSYPTGGVAGGVGYLPAWYAVYAPDSPWKPYSSRTGTVNDWQFGALGMRIAAMSAGATQSYTVTGTSADILYTTNGGTFAYSVDGGTGISVNTAGPYTTDHRVRATFPSAGTHVVKIAATSGMVYLEGVMAYNGDEARGIVLYDNAHSGFTSDAFVNARGETDALLKRISPDLVTIELGVNDWLHDTATPARLTANLRSEVGNIRSVMAGAKSPSIVLVIPYAFSGTDADGFTWSQYAAAIRAVVTADPSLGLLDMTSMGTARAGGLWSGDALHPSDSGHAEMARRAGAYLAGT